MNSTSGDIQRKKSLNRFIGRFFWGNSFLFGGEYTKNRCILLIVFSILLYLLEKKRVLSRLRPCTLLYKENHRLLPSRYPVLHGSHLFIADFIFIIANPDFIIANPDFIIANFIFIIANRNLSNV